MKLALSLSAALAAFLVSTAPPAAASTVAPGSGFYINYQPTTLYEVDDIGLFEQGLGASGYGLTTSFTAPVGTSTITDPFLKFNPIVNTFVAGVATDLPGDPAGQQHLVLFTNDTFAAAAQNIAFGTLFPNTDEATLISALEAPNAPGSFGALSDFASGDATGGPNGAVAFAPGAAFTEIAFSGGQTIGAGVSFETNPDGSPIVSAAPEPGTWMLMIGGLGVIGLALRRRVERAFAGA